MSLHLSSRRVLTSTLPLPTSQPFIQHRAFTLKFLERWREGTSKPKTPQNPLTEEFLKRKAPAPQRRPKAGDLAPGTILDDGGDRGEKTKRRSITRNQAAMAATLDPSPTGRMQFQRKMVIREIRRRGRLNKKETLKRTERELLLKSHDFQTSVKKLVPLAKQIAGKTVDDAIIQMRFSKKKAAKEVKAHLEHAKNEAIVKRGMGHGQVKGAEKNFTPVKIITKDGKRVTVEDPTTMYVDQAWCNKGLFGITPDFRARGNTNLMKNRTTSLTLILKEEATRLRLNEERENKIKNRKVWVQLPNRPVTAQRQYYSW